ncbi:MAG: hypothetical protein A2666_05225 [Parcubacteria group bacterium RIFCSPHIGHO2_01_FULL_47_10b]|nr:MAG: hypothetical protein A2666_05225 [Parcubacteria group bacterium RIFCSPHIGHO2_01_FULL_47_10b]
MIHIQRAKNAGYITLISVLVVGAVGVAIVISLLQLGLGTSRTSFTFRQSSQARALAHACAEEALQQIHDNTAFTGSGNLTLGQGSCDYTVTSQGAGSRTINASGLAGTVVRKEQVVINDISPLIQVVTWQEVSDF